MGFLGSLTGSSQRKDIRKAYNESTDILNQGYGQAQGNLTSGYNGANSAYDTATGNINQGYGNALSALGKGVNQAVETYQPWYQSGTQANTMYGNALGLNGAAQQAQFMRGYKANPFMQANNDFATRAIMQQMNARGMSGSGTAAAAVAQESMRRGADDYNNYLGHLSGVSGQGLQAAGQIGGLYAQQGKDTANMYAQQGSDLANISGQRANLGWQYGQGQAGLNTDLAATRAGNRINYGNARAQSRGILGNNLMGLLGAGINAYSAFKR
ncbi:MAG: hypothetical protein IPL32_18650 [Chloracidobacterium sp.]|nr:hypothetical protein [Chloracidobacterium sp.]